ncbi:MAG: hypothetical protein JSW07_08485, partial [bacterium]
KNWDDSVGIGLNLPKDQDKEWRAVDLTNSPFRNRKYVAETEFDWNGTNDLYNKVTSGVYLYRIRMLAGEVTKKMILLR